MQYILTEEEYQALKSSSQDQLLRDTNAQLKAKLDEMEADLDKPQRFTKESTLDSPFIVTNEHLCLRSPTDFIVMYNNLSEPTLSSSDKSMFLQLVRIAEILNYEPQFKDQKDLKAYRVSLQKKNLCSPVVKDGKRYLEFPSAITTNS